MKNWWNKHFWAILWWVLGGLTALWILVAFWDLDKSWQPTFMYTLGIMISVSASVMMFLRSRRESERALHLQLDRMQEMHGNEIKVLQEGFNRQLQTITTETQRQIDAFGDHTQAQIQALTSNTERQLASMATLTEEVK